MKILTIEIQIFCVIMMKDMPCSLCQHKTDLGWDSVEIAIAVVWQMVSYKEVTINVM